jgi:hypothetical protein
MRKTLILLLAVFAAGVLAYAISASLTGDWTFTMTTARGEMTSDLKFVQDGEKLTVTMTSQRGGQAVETKGEGTVKGNEVEWKITRTTQRGEFTTTYKGTIVDDNNLKGTMEGGFGGGGGGQAPEWKATRKK